jgi:hypothetical protein
MARTEETGRVVGSSVPVGRIPQRGGIIGHPDHTPARESKGANSRFTLRMTLRTSRSMYLLHRRSERRGATDSLTKDTTSG